MADVAADSDTLDMSPLFRIIFSVAATALLAAPLLAEEVHAEKKPSLWSRITTSFKKSLDAPHASAMSPQAPPEPVAALSLPEPWIVHDPTPQNDPTHYAANNGRTTQDNRNEHLPALPLPTPSDSLTDMIDALQATSTPTNTTAAVAAEVVPAEVVPAGSRRFYHYAGNLPPHIATPPPRGTARATIRK